MKIFKKALSIALAVGLCTAGVGTLAACSIFGADGESKAYQAWLDNGNSGTQEDFLDWVKNGGSSGGDQSGNQSGTTTPQKSEAYEAWLENGHTGTEAQFLAWVKNGGDKQSGTTTPAKNEAYEAWLEQGNTGTEADFIAWVKNGGTAGGNQDGTTDSTDAAYKIWLENGNKGTKEDFFVWLRFDGNAPVTDRASLEYAFNTVYSDGNLRDLATGFSDVNDLTGARYFVDGKYQDTYTKYTGGSDTKYEFYNKTGVRIADVPNGIVYTVPTKAIKADYSIGKYRAQYYFDDSILTTTAEKNYYTGNWYTYGYEWLMMYINNEEYIQKNNLERINGTKAYNFTKVKPQGDTVVKNILGTKTSFDVYRFDIHVKDSGATERPYYNIAIVRKDDDFVMFVMKSKEDRKEVMDTIVSSYYPFPKMGTAKNYFYAGESFGNPNWSAETKAYYEKLMDNKSVDWGVFSYSMPGTEDALNPGQAKYNSMLAQSKEMKEGVEKALNYSYDIYPTYTHLSWYNEKHHFPLSMAKELAGGNGFDGKPVLQFTYQFTTDNNNLKGTKLTPLFDIMRGNWDEHLHRLAQDIKAYGKPMLFRLNNEMNSDWTSYCGMMTLLDPDVYRITWQRLYDIFEEEGVNNVIWIWNPNDVSCPYSMWGEDLCYFPGVDYVQLLGGTCYDMNNQAGGTSADAFKAYYKSLYEKNAPTFAEWGMIVSEFACGSGGETTGELGRNAAAQAKWVENMFKELNATTKPDWVKMIKGAVWFNCNDSVAVGNEYKITNRLRIYEPNSTAYDDLAATIAAFRAGLQIQKANENA